MANHAARGSSLLQARKSTHHNHNQHRHLHNLLTPAARHHHSDTSKSENQQHHVRSPEEDLHQLQNRQVVVIQTVSVVHVIDGAGATIGVQTLLPVVPESNPNNLQVTPPSLKQSAGVTADAADALGNETVPSAPAAVGDNGAQTSSTASAPAGLTSGTASVSLNSGQGSLTSIPSSSLPATRFPTLSAGVFSSNSSRLLPSLFSNSTIGPHSLFVNTTSTKPTSFSTTSKPTSSKSRSSSTLWTSSDASIVTPLTVPGGIGGVPGNGGAATVAEPAPTASETTPPAGPGLTPEAQGAVAGGVVGGVAGIALIVLVAMFLLRWKKRQGGAIMLLGDGDSPVRGGGKGLIGGSGGGGGGMIEQQQSRSIPFAIPSALASLTGGNHSHKRLLDGSGAGGTGSSSSGEKGFYRVSGKKLVSVLQSGGDGYSDPENPNLNRSNPHDSMISTSSSHYYRDSLMPNLPPQRLQLGSPMRPESGVMVMRSGPGRTPVQESTPFSSEYFSEGLTTPPIGPDRDPLGRSLLSQDRSRVSANSGSTYSRTKFTEEGL